MMRFLLGFIGTLVLIIALGLASYGITVVHSTLVLFISKYFSIPLIRAEALVFAGYVLVILSTVGGLLTAVVDNR